MSESNSNSLLNRRLSAKTELILDRLDSRTSVNSRRSTVSSNCRICLSNILDPASLTCGHRFCERCLHQYWRVEDEPQFIVCPLCRKNAFNVDFAKKEDITSTKDFRKTFKTVENLNCVCQSHVTKATLLCLKISILMPLFYFMLQWLGVPVVQLLTLLKIKLGHNLV